jgi:hypothetical protein
VGRGGDGDDGGIHQTRHLAEISERPSAVGGGYFGGALGIHVHHGGQLRALGFVNDAAVIFPELAGADYSESNLRHD